MIKEQIDHAVFCMEADFTMFPIISEELQEKTRNKWKKELADLIPKSEVMEWAEENKFKDVSGIYAVSLSDLSNKLEETE